MRGLLIAIGFLEVAYCVGTFVTNISFTVTKTVKEEDKQSTAEEAAE